ncbi:hypothetical protein BU17DRAFT_97233 [Hysterangium stoloniferum]|nr:hypothetical protein BU17DRAFT_97233 [Hysterangium stoloniferum]
MSNSADTDEQRQEIFIAHWQTSSRRRKKSRKVEAYRATRISEVPLQPQHLRIVDNKPEALSFNQRVSSKPAESPQKEHEKGMEYATDATRQEEEASQLPQLPMDVENQKLSRSPIPLNWIISFRNMETMSLIRSMFSTINVTSSNHA